MTITRHYRVMSIAIKVSQQKKSKNKTYSTRDSLVVTHPTTSLAIRGLSMGERTGSRVFHYLWPYVLFTTVAVDLIPGGSVGGCPLNTHPREMVV